MEFYSTVISADDVRYHQVLRRMEPFEREIYEYVVNKEVELTKEFGLNRPDHKTPVEYASLKFNMTVDEVTKILIEASEKFKNPF